MSKMDDRDSSSLAYTGVTDVNEGAWYAAPVAWSTANGMSVGYGGGQFGPEDRITREQLVLMLYRYKGMPAVKQPNFTNIMDGETVSPWAQEAVAWAMETNILVGNKKGLLMPQGFASRAEVAAMVYKFMSR